MRIGIIDTWNSLGDSLRAALDSQPFLTVTAQGMQPDIIISSHAHGRDCTESLHFATEANTAIPVLVIAEQVRESDIHQLLTMGVSGILFQGTAAQHFSWAIPAVSNGFRVLSPEITEAVISEYLGPSSMTPQEKSARERIRHLSHREHEVLHLLSCGMSNREIGRSLFISPETVKDHVRAIRSKLGAPTRVHAAQVAWLARDATARNAA